MKHLTLLSLSLIASLTAAWADNSVKTVTQVSEAVTISDDVDYHISSETPFTATGSVNITNTDHAVLILDALKPSLALGQLAFVTINGEPAKNGTNCQVKIHNRGAIIMPYASDIKPLTVFSEKGFQGESCNAFGLEDTGGFMNTLTDAKLNNRIQSFKLKRGYMVTFATGKKGAGYSRCFIADKADLEMDLPNLLSNKVSSYRVFKWNDCSKAGLASDTNSGTNAAVNSTSCYDWAEGKDMGIDRECVANHIYEDWPSAATCGKTPYSPMMKTNNEPGNSADDHPQSVATVLANWQNLMATGKRLCSPSSHDGSLSWLREFIDSIDARGWRCDIMDVHCYWPEGSFNNLANWYSSYGNRPLWISEWVWGASWNKNGVFTSGWDDSYRVSQNAVVVKRILDNMNSWGYVERYFYWNGEQWYSRIYNDGALTPTGEYYASMNTGVGYNKAYDKYVPKAPRMGKPSELDGKFTASKRTYKLTWKEPNGEFNNSMTVERKIDNGQWVEVANVALQDTEASYTYTDTLVVGGRYSYRIHTVDYAGINRYSNELPYTMSTATAIVEDEQGGNIQFGQLSVADKSDVTAFLSGNFAEQPAVVFSSMSNRNYKASLQEHLVSVSGVTGSKNSVLKFNILSWNSGTTVSNDMTNAEYFSFIAAQKGAGKIGSLNYEAGITDKSLIVGSTYEGKDTAWVTFMKPFEEIPVVLVSPFTYGTATNPYPVTARPFDITKEGFKVILQRQATGPTGTRQCKVSFLAIDKGQSRDGRGHIVTVRDSVVTSASGLSNKTLYYGNNDKFANPVVYAQMQTRNNPALCVLRLSATGAKDYYTTVRYQIDDTDSENGVITSSKPISETVGYIVICDEEGSVTTGIRNIDVAKGIAADGVYNINGVKVAENTDNLPKGIYLIKKQGKSYKYVNRQ